MPSVTPTKFYCFVEDLAKKKHDLSSDTFKLLLTNSAPSVSDTVVDGSGSPYVVKATSNANEIAAGNGYTAGGVSLTNVSCAQTTGTLVWKLSAASPTWTASPSAMATFRYVVLYNSSAGTSSTRPVVHFYDYGVGGVTLNASETFTVTFDSTNGVFQLS